MIEERTGDIFEQEDINILMHCANLYHVFGAGIAKKIFEKYPGAYAADRATPYGSEAKLGTFSFARCEGPGDKRITVVNLYGQLGIGNDGAPEDRNIRYDALYNSLLKFKRGLEAKIKEKKYSAKKPAPWVVGIPYGMGSGLAGGSWTIVRAMVESLFAGAKEYKVVIVRLPGQKDLN